MNYVSPLKSAFADARKANSMQPVYVPLLEAKLFAITVSGFDLPGGFFLTKPPGEDQFCVTVSENRDWLPQTVDVTALTGKELILAMRPNMDIIIIYGDGGDFFQSAHVDHIRQSLSAAVQKN